MTCVVVDGHAVDHFNQAFFGQETSEQKVGIRQIKLPYPHVRHPRSNLKSAAILVIEQRGKHCRRIELRIAQEVDRPVHPDQCNRLHVADHAVIFDWFKSHTATLEFVDAIRRCKVRMRLNYRCAMVTAWLVTAWRHARTIRVDHSTSRISLVRGQSRSEQIRNDFCDASAQSRGIDYATHFSRSADAAIRVYDAAGNVIEAHEHKGDFVEW